MKTPTTLIFCALAVLALVAVQPAKAGDAAWTGGSLDALWSNTDNWSASPVPGTGNTATFNAAAGAGGATIDVATGGALTIQNITFDTASAAAYTIGSGAVGSQTLTLDNTAAVTMNGAVAANQLFNAAVTLGTTDEAGTTTFTNDSTTNTLTCAGNITGSSNVVSAGAKILAVAGAGNTTISGIIDTGTAASVAVTKTGDGTLTFSTTTKTYTGETKVNAGILLLQAGLSAVASRVVTVDNTSLTSSTLNNNGGDYNVGNGVAGNLLTIQNGGVVTNINNFNIGVGATDNNNKVTVDGNTLGNTSKLIVGKTLSVGVSGSYNTLEIKNGAQVSNWNWGSGYTYVGQNAGAVTCPHSLVQGL